MRGDDKAWLLGRNGGVVETTVRKAVDENRSEHFYPTECEAVLADIARLQDERARLVREVEGKDERIAEQRKRVEDLQRMVRDQQRVAP